MTEAGYRIQKAVCSAIPDGGESWAVRAEGMWAAYMPPERKNDPVIQDPHRIVQCAAAPEALWAQHHNGVFRSTDGARSWKEITVPPSSFGFAIAVHPRDPDTAWFVPAVKDELRVPVNGQMVGGSHPRRRALSMSYRRKFIQSLATFLVCVALALPLAAQKERWEKLMGEVSGHYYYGRYSEAVPVAEEALRVAEAAFGPEHNNVAISLASLAGLYERQGKYAEAEALYKRSLAIREKALGADHPDVALSLGYLMRLYYDQGKYAEAEPLLKRSLAIKEKAYGPDHPNVAIFLEGYAKLLRKLNRQAEATAMESRAKAIRAKKR